MRTTLDIEDDILQAAKELAAKEKSTAGEVISRLARKGLLSPVSQISVQQMEVRNGVPVFPARLDEVVTLDHVERLMDEEGI
ncbi:hypothetical protein [Luteolibacter soli]|uniref:Antitoxin n=1 Tax=Luteolibacter soli TaxID=3135280 RepID=A0ABU9B1M7_9BACT